MYTREHTIKNPASFDVDDLFHESITNHNKEFDLCLAKNKFILIFDNELYLHVKSGFRYNTTICTVRIVSLSWIERFHERECIFSHVYEMTITTSGNERYMNYECSIKQPIQMVK